MNKPKICLIEPCHSHEEVLFPMINLLRDDYDVHVLAPQSLLDVDILSRTRRLYTGVPIRWDQEAARWRRLLRMPGKYREIRHLVDSIGPEVVVFNSTYERSDLMLIDAFFKGIPKAQVIHNFQRFLKPGMRRIYEAFDLNLVISEEVYGYVTEHQPEYRSLDYFLPIFFGGFEAGGGTAAPPPTEPDPILHLGVFGSAGNYRRNYQGLLRSLTAWGRSDRAPGFVLHLVGELPGEYRDFVNRHDLGHVVRCHDQFVPFEEMFRILRSVDIVLFLIDATVRDCAAYNRCKITGSSTLIKGFRKACAASRDFKLDEILEDKCFLYDGSHVEELFESIANGSIDKAAVREREARYEGNLLLTREEQKARLVRALKGVRAARAGAA